MKEHQFEEIVFWLSVIATLVAYSAGLSFVAAFLCVWSVFNCYCMVVTAKEDLKQEQK